MILNQTNVINKQGLSFEGDILVDTLDALEWPAFGF